MSKPIVLEVSGSAREAGQMHGETFRQRIKLCSDFYQDLFGLPHQDLVRRADVFARLIREYSPDIADEIEGIADGAGLAHHRLYALNARSELVPFAVPECTAIFAPATAMLAQTWDWARELEPLVFLLHVVRENSPRLLTVTEPGIVGKIGLSSAGVGVCLNFLAAPRQRDGVPIHAVLREALHAGSLDQAAERVRAAGPGRSGNIMLGSATGRGVNFEFAGDQFDERPVTDTFLHTNHCLFHDLDAGDAAASSHSRLDRGRELLGENKSVDARSLQQLLSDGCQSDLSICRPYVEFHGLDIGTVCTVLMDLAAGALQLRLGTDPSAKFTNHGV